MPRLTRPRGKLTDDRAPEIIVELCAAIVAWLTFGGHIVVKNDLIDRRRLGLTLEPVDRWLMSILNHSRAPVQLVS